MRTRSGRSSAPSAVLRWARALPPSARSARWSRCSSPTWWASPRASKPLLTPYFYGDPRGSHGDPRRPHGRPRLSQTKAGDGGGGTRPRTSVLNRWLQAFWRRTRRPGRRWWPVRALRNAARGSSAGDAPAAVVVASLPVSLSSCVRFIEVRLRTIATHFTKARLRWSAAGCFGLSASGRSA
jgi:hypothetical protein